MTVNTVSLIAGIHYQARPTDNTQTYVYVPTHRRFVTITPRV